MLVFSGVYCVVIVGGVLVLFGSMGVLGILDGGMFV